MQFLIDTNEESPRGILAAAVALVAHANLSLGADESMEVVRAAGHRPPAPTPVPAPSTKPVHAPAPPAPLAPDAAPPPPVIHPEFHPDATPEVPAGTQLDLDPAAIFGGNVVPLVSAATATVAATSTAPLTLVPATAPPPVPGAVNAAASAAEPSTAKTPLSATAEAQGNVAADGFCGERDKAGLIWDARVHSETRKVNADGTWRFRRNLDEAVKAQVMAELKGAKVTPATAQTLNFTPTEAAALAVAPPPPPPPGGIAPPPPAAIAPPPPVSLPVASTPPVPLQNAADVGVRNTRQQNVVQPGAGAPVTSFRDLMNKVNQALAGGRITQPQLVEACKSAGVEGVSALAAQPMLVPTVDTYLNRWLAAGGSPVIGFENHAMPTRQAQSA